MTIFKSNSNENKQKSKLSFPDAPLVSEKKTKKNSLSDAEKAWVDLIEHGETAEILPSKTDEKPGNDKNKK